MEMHPDVSVLTPSFGYAEFIEDAVLSVLDQKDVAVEHIIQDGGSKDGTLELLRRFGDRIVWRSEPDSGQSDAMNKALRRARGRWIGWLNADEFYLPNALAPLVRLGDRAGVDVVYGDVVLMDRSGRFLRLQSRHPFNAFVLRKCCPVLGSCASIFRRSALGDDPWDQSLRRIMDWDLYLKLTKERANFLYIPYPVGAFRLHSDRMTALPAHSFMNEYETLLERHGVPPSGLKKRLGVAMYRFLKALDGAYVREMKARKLKGLDLRWFKEDVRHEVWTTLGR